MLEGRTDNLPVNFQQLSLLRKRAHERLEKMVAYARTTSCRMNFTLNYFGAEVAAERCGNCDNCTIGKSLLTEAGGESLSAVEIYRIILSLVKETQGRYGRSTYCKILLEGTDKLTEEHREKFAGVLRELPPQVVFEAFDSLLLREYLTKTKFINPTVSITEGGKRFLQTGITLPTKKQFKFRKGLYKALREERRILACEMRLPVFAVSTDEDLIRIANARPSTETELIRYLPQTNSKEIIKRFMQVCIDFAPAENIELQENERQIYELYLEQFTASEIASSLQTSIQNVIDVIGQIHKRGYKIDFKKLIDKRKLSRITSELGKVKNPAEAHKELPDCELSEVILVSKILNAFHEDKQL